MIYADTDFFIALVKDDDWLQQRAATLAEEHEGDIASAAAVSETMITII